MGKGAKIALIVILLLILLGIGAGGFLLWYLGYLDPWLGGGENANTETNENLANANTETSSGEFKKFANAEEFSLYLEEGAETETYMYGTLGMDSVIGDLTREMDTMPLEADLKESDAGLGGLERVSETNVQVEAIDEPDIVKTDGETIYYSPEDYYGPIFLDEAIPIGDPEVAEDALKESYIMPEVSSATKVVTAFPPEDLASLPDIENYGELLLYEDTLLIFGLTKVYAFDVSDPASPEKLWTMEYSDTGGLTAARLYNGTLYLITQTYVDAYDPCPMNLMTIGEETLTVDCTDIYHPPYSAPVDVTYNVAKIDPRNGEIKDNVSIVGSTFTSIVYMSEDNIYLTYFYPGDMISYVYGFMKENEDLFPKALVDKVKKLPNMDISDAAKLTELTTILEEYSRSLSSDEQLKLENDLYDRFENYANEHLGELENTGIVKIGNENLTPDASGTIPGELLNQFSLDEYQGNLRAATTLGGGSVMGFGSSTESKNEVYVLDKDLKELGKITDLGLDERIYSARFIGDKGYLVTFKETDPFYILDLSSPADPKMAGELKIPGYSSYLHPLEENLILGVGKEEDNVKLSLFDVSDDNDPKELDKYSIQEYWTDVLDTHHAFLQDAEHKVFFIPGSKGGYVFSYDGDKLTMEKAVSGITADRAIYINDYMYIIGTNKIVVLDESDWEQIAELEFGQE